MLNFLRKIIAPKNFLRFWYYQIKSFWAAVWYGFPSRKLKIIGVTGTDGKTTTVNLIAHLLNQNGRKTGMISTTAFSLGGKKIVNETKRTSVSPFLTQKLLRQMITAGCEFAVLEVSSHALEQKRFWGVNFDIAVLTNITPEHLDYHKTLEEYRRIKARLFQELIQHQRENNQPKIMVLNYSDPVFTEFSKFQADQKISYGFDSQADFFAEEIELKPDYSSFQLCHSTEKVKVKLLLIGQFNIENALAAAAVGNAVGVNLKQIQLALETFTGVEGRMEKIEAGQDFNVIVDFALTPEALRKLFATARAFTTGKLIGVLGCGGERDRGKRPVIGEMAAQMLDLFILTDDETYQENPAQIREEIKAGILKTNKIKDQDWYEISDRLKAIQFAFKKAQKGDTVLIPGMGAETTRNLGGIEVPWDEREIVKKELAKI